MGLWQYSCLHSRQEWKLKLHSGAWASALNTAAIWVSHSWLQPSGEYRGSVGRFNYYLSGDYLENNIGITSATPDNPIHDQTKQGHAFGYFEYLIDATSKVSAIFGAFVGHFQIPNSRDQVPPFSAGRASYRLPKTNLAPSLEKPMNCLTPSPAASKP